MLNSKISLQSLTIFMVGLSLIPRLLTPYALQIGTIYILFFWIPFLVLFPDMLNDYEKKSFSISKFPRSSKILLGLILLLIVITIIFKNVIYDKNAGSFIANFRRSLYLIHPFICLTLCPFLRKNNNKFFFKLLLFMTGFMVFFITVPSLIDKGVFSYKLNEITAQLSSWLMNLVSDLPVYAKENKFGNSNFLIEVKQGCSSINQIFLSFSAIIIFYICCKIKSKIKLFFIALFTITLSFILNAIRITILGKIVSIDKMEAFDFWHSGNGSLIFSFITMSCCSVFYYYIWCKENPIIGK